jgi:hypothetical protein
MPPKAQWYLLGRNSEEKDNQSNFDKFFDLERIAEGLTVISMEDFLQQTAAKGLLKVPLPAEFQNVKVCMYDCAVLKWFKILVPWILKFQEQLTRFFLLINFII